MRIDCIDQTLEDTIFPDFHTNDGSHGKVDKWREGEEMQ